MLWSEIKQGRRIGRVGLEFQRAVREGFRKRDALSRALKGVQGRPLECLSKSFPVHCGECDVGTGQAALGAARRSVWLERREEA